MAVLTVNLSSALLVSRQIGIKIDLGTRIQDLNKNDIAQLSDILAHHGVICLINQTLTPDDFLAFVKQWGSLVEQISPDLHYYPDIGPTLTGVGNVCADGSIIQRYVHGESWHHDGTCWQPRENYLATFLHAKILPKEGGATGFIDTELAYDLLPDDLKARLAHGTFTVNLNLGSDHINKGIPAATHRVVSIHPRSKKPCLYVANPPADIVDEITGEFIMKPEELFALIQKSTVHIEYQWSPGDLLIFDNLQTLHRSMGGYGDHPRLLHRCQVRLPFH